MTEERIKIVQPILNTFENDDIREFAIELLNNLPEYIWLVGASSTGKYHPQYSLGDGGLMRHQIAVARFLNFFFELEQYNNKLTSREMDLMRLSGLVHDGRKSGNQSDFIQSKYTRFNHPKLMADIVRSYDGKYLTSDEIEFVASNIESHMGQWNTDKKSAEVLPRPQNNYQRLIHLADYLASRKCLTMDFDDYEAPAIPDINEYKVTFGKHKGLTLVEINKIDQSYILWAKENMHKEPIKTLLKQL